ncbi:hypothetical protein CDL15_Pgr006348 [Punica granatum]|nr:hypothetical protein CDL15_Pgr006348 [Punica granatum]
MSIGRHARTSTGGGKRMCGKRQRMCMRVHACRDVPRARAQRADVATGAGTCTGVDEHSGAHARGDAERLALELVASALFT